MSLSPCAPRLSCCPPAGRDTATLILTMELPEENVAAPVAAQQVASAQDGPCVTHVTVSFVTPAAG